VKALLLVCVAPLAIAIANPASQAPTPAWLAAIAMTILALATVLGMDRWQRRGRGADVARTLGWRYVLLTVSLIAVPVTLSALFLFSGKAIGQPGLSVIVGELTLLQFIMGIASMSAPRNGLLGFRTPRTLADDSSWRKANRHWGRRLAAASPLAMAGLAAGQWGPLVAWLPAAVIGIAFLIADAR
jgi:uncharacterized membrane protein